MTNMRNTNVRNKQYSVGRCELHPATLPVYFKKAIRKMLKENLDIARTGKKFLVERKQLEDFLRNNI